MTKRKPADSRRPSGEESTRARPAPPWTPTKVDSGRVAVADHPDETTLTREEHLAGLWDVLGIGD